MDKSILLWLQDNLRMPILNDVMIFITTLGNAGALWIILASAFLCSRKTRRVGIYMLISLLLSFLINNMFLKNAVHRQRPWVNIENFKILIKRPVDFSFPSGHTASSFAAAVVIYLLGYKRMGIVAIIMAVLIGFSRMYVGVHYPTDVLSGAVSGIIIAFLVVYFFNKNTFTNIY